MTEPNITFKPSTILGMSVNRASKAMRSMLHGFVDGTAMNFAEWHGLNLVNNNGGTLARGALAAQIARNQEMLGDDAVAVVDGLVAAGWLQVTGDELTDVTITEAGWCMFLPLRASADDIGERMFDFTAEDIATATRVVTLLAERCEAQAASGRTLQSQDLDS